MKCIFYIYQTQPHRRGCGGSNADDYEPPHSVQSATEDVITLIQSICPSKYVRPPSIIVGFGALGKAMALSYLDATAAKGAVTKSTHSEISGYGSVPQPTCIVLLPAPTNEENNSKYDEDVCRDLQLSANESLGVNFIESNTKCVGHSSIDSASALQFVCQQLTK